MATWPDDSALATFATAAGIDASGGTLTTLMSGKSAAMKNLASLVTGWNPLISDGTTSVRTYDPPGPHTATGPQVWHGGGSYLDLGAALLTIDGTTPIRLVLDDGSTFRLFDPTKGDYKLQPYNLGYTTRVAFRSPVRFFEGSLEVKGIWGRFGSSAVPDDIVEAAKQFAIAMAQAPQTVADLSTGLAGWSELHVSETHESRQAFEALAYARAAFIGACLNYVRVVC